MREVSRLMGNDRVKAQADTEHCGNVIIEMLRPRPDHAHIMYYVASFISRS